MPLAVERGNGRAVCRENNNAENNNNACRNKSNGNLANVQPVYKGGRMQTRSKTAKRKAMLKKHAKSSKASKCKGKKSASCKRTKSCKMAKGKKRQFCRSKKNKKH